MIERLIKNNKEIILIGTAHISKESVDEVKSTIEAEKPDVVCVELCKQRYEILNDKEKWKQTDITKIIKEGKTALFLVNLILSNFQRRLGEDVGILPGAEMTEAMNVAKNLNIPI
ncbi:MAG: TraB family protein, partial [Candidatus Altiarchaeales archaeon HGW-Altiarchaeales-2]